MMHAFAIPLRTPVRGVSVREGLLLRGAAGWGEFSPFADYSDVESVQWLLAAREAAAGDWPAPIRTEIPVNCLVPAVAPEAAASIVAESGCATAKVKVAQRGETLGDDLARVAAVRATLGPAGKLRVDANGAWNVADAVTAIRTLARYDLEYVEQPSASIDELAAVRRQVDVPIAADESVRRVDDPLRVARTGAADIVVLKVQPLGGVRRCLEIAAACGLPVVVSSALDTSIGLAAGVALAAALPELPYACGLGTALLARDDVVAEPLLPHRGMLPVRAITVDTVAMRRVAASHDRAQWWQRRHEAVAAIVDSREPYTAAASGLDGGG